MQSFFFIGSSLIALMLGLDTRFNLSVMKNFVAGPVKLLPRYIVCDCSTVLYEGSDSFVSILSS